MDRAHPACCLAGRLGSTFDAVIRAVGAIPGSSSVWGVGAIGSGNSSSQDNTLVAVNGPLP
jgi:hypothetical protein